MTTLEKYILLFANKCSVLKDIDHDNFRFSHILLFREYQTRLYKWKRALKYNGPDLFNKNKSFHNLFTDLSPSWIEEIISEEKVADSLSNIGFEGVYTTHRDYYAFFISMYLNWELFKDRVEIAQYQHLPHPYETLYITFTNGGYIFNSEKKFEISTNTYLKQNSDFRMPSISNKFLDFIDAKCTDYPNQAMVDYLWEEFNIKT